MNYFQFNIPQFNEIPIGQEPPVPILPIEESLNTTYKARIIKVYPVKIIEGSQITIVGLNFGYTPGTVRFGSQIATTVSWRNDIITVIAPANIDYNRVSVEVR